MKPARDPYSTRIKPDCIAIIQRVATAHELTNAEALEKLITTAAPLLLGEEVKR